jgi:hypothetical protein
MASRGFRHYYSFAGFGLYILSSGICLIFLSRGGNFEFLTGLYSTEIILGNGEEIA